MTSTDKYRIHFDAIALRSRDRPSTGFRLQAQNRPFTLKIMALCRHLPDIVLQQSRERPDKGALWVTDQGCYRALSFQALWNRIQAMAIALSGLSVQRGDRVAILAQNRPEWVIADLAIMAIGGIVVPVYPTLSAEEIAFILNDCQVKAIFTEDAAQDQKIRAQAKELGSLQCVIRMEDGSEAIPGIVSHSFSELAAQGAHVDARQQAGFLSGLEAVSREQVASIVYTSGTTGTPKGVQLTHENFLSNVEDILAALTVTASDSVLSFLPLSHVFERTTGYYTVLAAGGAIYYARSMDTIAEDMAVVKPTVVISVPRLYEKMHARIYGSLSGVKKAVFFWALGVGKQASRLREAHHPFPLILKWKWRLAVRLVFAKIQGRTGGRIRFFVSGGAPLSPELALFFDTIGLLILEGYGLTETSPVIAFNRPDDRKLGTVGKPLARMQVRIAVDGELDVKGPSVMKGYYHRPAETAEAIDSDGWFHTGDIAELDSDGFLKIIGRKKELIVLSNGKKVAPAPLENRLLESRYISQVMVVGEGRNYLTALIVPEFDQLKAYAEKAGITDGHSDAFLASESAQSLYRSVIQEKVSNLARFEQIKKFRLLLTPFSIESKTLTPSLKIRRQEVLRQYHTLIDQMYAEA